MELKDFERRPLRAEELTERMTSQIGQIHRFSCEVPQDELGTNPFRLKYIWEAMGEVLNIYHQVPQKHHLEIEVTPKAYYRLKERKRLGLKQVQDKDAIRYYLTVDRFIADSQILPEGQSLINLQIDAGNEAYETRVPWFSVTEVGRDRHAGARTRLSVIDLLNVHIKPDPEPQKVSAQSSSQKWWETH